MDWAFVFTIIIAGILTGGIYSIIAVNLNFQFGALKVVNFSYGALLMLGMYLVFTLLTTGVNALLTLGILLPLYFVIGWALRRFIVFTNMEDIQILLTMGVAIIIENLAHSIWGAYPRSMETMEKGLVLGDLYISLTRLEVFLISLAILAIAYLFLTKSWYGRCVRAVVQNKEMASVMGINSRRVAEVAFAISVSLLAVSGYLLMKFYSVEPHTGGSFFTMAILIVVLGGLGNLMGSFLASFIIGILSSVISFFVPGYHDPILFSLFILLILIRPTGLFGEA